LVKAKAVVAADDLDLASCSFTGMYTDSLGLYSHTFLRIPIGFWCHSPKDNR
jgi:hypothetical protein